LSYSLLRNTGLGSGNPSDRSAGGAFWSNSLLFKTTDQNPGAIGMQKLFIAFLFCLAFGIVTASGQTEYCFHNDGLKLQQNVSFTVTKNKIEGTFESGGYDDNTSAETFDFTGTKVGNLLRIRFAGKKAPYEMAPGTKRIVWTLGTKTLKIPTFGKNYNTRKYSAYIATYEKCKSNQ
jgi:hypothetical protein